MGTRLPQIVVLHIISSAETAGGERYLMDLVRYSNMSIRHQIVLPHNGPFQQVLRDGGYSCVIINLHHRFSLTAIRQLVHLVRKCSANIIHTHGYRANFYGHIVGLLSGIACISTIHVSLFDYIDTQFITRCLYIFIEKVFAFKTSKYICVSQAMEKDMHKMGIAPHKTVLIHNGVDLKKFHQRSNPDQCKASLGIDPGVFLIGTVGRLVPEKGQIYLIKALSYLKNREFNLKCLFVGEGQLLEKLKLVARKMEVDHICEFTGSRTDMEFIYPAMDLFVLPSLREPFGLAILEAMASGVPVIATDAGGPRSIIRQGVNGYLVPVKDERALAMQMIDLLENKNDIDRIGRAGRETVEDRFDIRNTVQKIDEVYYSQLGLQSAPLR